LSNFLSYLVQEAHPLHVASAGTSFVLYICVTIAEEAVMKILSYSVLLLFVGAGFLGLASGCSMSGSAESYNQTIEAHPIDGMNRDITESQMGAVHESPSLSPPPVRPDFAYDR
jgi:hypothetical protein